MTDEREFPGFDDVYEITNPSATRPYHGKITDDAQAMRVSKAMRSDGLLDDEPIGITHLMGGAVPGEVFWADAIIGPFVSIRVIDLLVAEQVTGWTSYSTEVTTKTGTVLDGYELLMAIGSPCAVLDHKGKRKPSPFNSNVFYFVGTQFDVATWNGSDIFRSGVSTPLLIIETG